MDTPNPLEHAEDTLACTSLVCWGKKKIPMIFKNLFKYSDSCYFFKLKIKIKIMPKNK